LPTPRAAEALRVGRLLRSVAGREALSKVKASVLGLYGGDDARVNATVPAAQAEMKRLGKAYEVETYAGAGHGFLRQQDAATAPTSRPHSRPGRGPCSSSSRTSPQDFDGGRAGALVAANAAAQADDDCGDYCACRQLTRVRRKRQGRRPRSG